MAGGALAAVAFGFASWPAALAQTAGGRAQAVITQAVNDGNLFGLAGNTRPEAQNAANDRGSAPDTMPMPHLLLQLRRPAAQEQALATLIDQLHDPNSPNYHHWLSAKQSVRSSARQPRISRPSPTGSRSTASPSMRSIQRDGDRFSGTAGQVRTAFTPRFIISVNGVTHFANVSDPQIPAALAPCRRRHSAEQNSARSR